LYANLSIVAYIYWGLGLYIYANLYVCQFEYYCILVFIVCQFEYYCIYIGVYMYANLSIVV
jgi:hypothetical protein